MLTDDGDIVNKILRSRNDNEKEYLVTTNKKITKAVLKKLENGVPILNTTTRKCQTRYINDYQFKIAKIRDVFPEPDSPTIPILSPIFKSKLTFLIAFT